MRKIIFGFLSLLLACPISEAEQPTRSRAPKKAEVRRVQIPNKTDQKDQTKAAEDRLMCLRNQAALQTELSKRTAACENHLMDFRNCVRHVRERQSSNTGKGALFGFGAAFLTGGASLLWTGAGALVGHEISSEAPEECGPLPVCDSPAILNAIDRDLGLHPQDCPP